MKDLKIHIALILFCVSCIIPGCSYNNLQPSVLDIDEAGSNFEISSAAKCHLIDGSVLIFQKGFIVSNNIVRGVGERFYFTEKEKISFYNNIIVESISLDSIVAITTYDDYTSARQIANGSMYFMGAVISGVTIYCISCPKCCFGSCPTVYTYSDGFASLETELFSSGIARMLEYDDLDKLKEKVPDNGIYKLKITNEALETHYINKFNLILAEHPLGTKIYPNIENGLTVIKNTIPADSYVNSEGTDVKKELLSEDTLIYRSSMNMVNELRNGTKYDHIVLTSPVPENSVNAKLIVRYKNTLLSTILFYDVLLGSQGIRAIEWTDKMNNDPSYASDFKMIYDNFSGMEFEYFYKGKWISAGKFPDAGPICWKITAAEVNVSDMKELKLRLRFIPDNFMIDYIGIEYDTNDNKNYSNVLLYPDKIVSNSNDPLLKPESLIEKSDKNYLITNPGDFYELTYKIQKRYDTEQSVLISSGGYYNEWIRGSWVKNDSTGRKFDLYNINENLKLLAQSWESNKTLVESEFFNTRIQIKEK